jgi:hypothetical protein
MLKLKSLPILGGAAALGALAFLSSPAGANPFLIAVCSSSSCPAGGDPNALNTANFRLALQDSGTSVTTPIIVLVGEPNSGAVSTPTLSVNNASPTVTAASGNNFYGLKVATNGTLTGVLETNIFNSGVAYDAAGLTGGGNSSESFTSWTMSPFPNGATNPDAGVSSFSIYAIAINVPSTTTWTDNITGLDIENVPAFSFVFAYGCKSDSPITAVCTQAGDNVGASSFTETGFVPAPPIGHGLVVLLAVGSVFLGGRLLENLKKRHLNAA